MALTGCGGDDGKDGNPGNPGGPAADVINVLNLDVTKVTYQDGTPTITVFATNEENLPVVGLQKLKVQKVAQLIPQGSTGAGNSAQWEILASYYSKFEDKKDGNYQFTIPVEGYDSELTQRFNIVASAGTLLDGTTAVPHTEYTEDFSGEGYAPLYTKNIVSHEACAACHAEGTSFVKENYHSSTTEATCATCHSSGLDTEKQWNHLIHNLHNSSKSFTTDVKTYDGVKAEALIQNNCKTCHIAPEEGSDELSEWGNWSRVPTMETCTSCHTGIDFQAGKGHSQQADNSNCIACHNASWTEEIHTEGFAQKKAFVDQYGMETSLTAAAIDAGSETTLSVTITDAAGTAIDAATFIGNIKQLEAITNVGPNYPIMGYNNNPINGEHKVLINLVKDGALSVEPKVEIIDGKFVTVIKDLPYGEGDTDTAFSFIGLSLCNDGTTAVKCEEGVSHTSMKAAMAHGTLSGEAASVRHTDSVNIKACESCHGTEWPLNSHTKYHAGFVMTEQLGREVNGEMVVGVDGCVTCHTPDGTYASGANMGSIEMKVHKVHSAGDYAAIAGMTCDQCHNDLNLDAFKKKGALATAGGAYTTPIAATCMSCHTYNEESLNKFKAHVEGQGAIVNSFDKQEVSDAAQLETCFFCHKPTADDHTSVKM